jgi:hypothetical protein
MQEFKKYCPILILFMNEYSIVEVTISKTPLHPNMRRMALVLVLRIDTHFRFSPLDRSIDPPIIIVIIIIRAQATAHSRVALDTNSTHWTHSTGPTVQYPSDRLD